MRGSYLNSLPRTLLGIIGVAGIVITAVLAPNAVRLFDFGRASPRDRNETRRRVTQALRRLRQRRLVALEERKKTTYLVITEVGRRYLKRLDFQGLIIRTPQRWDGKWRIVTFDVPERKRKIREALRLKLRELGLLQLQKSVWVYPHECRDEIDFTVHFLHLQPFVLYSTMNDLGPFEAKVRRAFGLL